MSCTSNKRSGQRRELYLQKQEEVLQSQVNLVEIDLLREGKHTVAVPEHLVRDNRLLGSWYSLISVRKAAVRQRFFVYPVRLDLPLPRIRIPLREDEPEVVLHLQAACTRAYDIAGFGDLLEYSRPPPLGLSAEEEQTIAEIVAKTIPASDA